MSLSNNMPSKRIFLHHIDDYEMNELRKHLIEENRKAECLKYEIFGSLHFSENLARVMSERHPLEIFNYARDNYVDKILTCDILIFNTSINSFEKVCFELRKVMHGLKEYCNKNEKMETLATTKYVVLLSLTLSWVATVHTVGDLEDEIDYFLEEDYRRRRPHKSYFQYKFLERDVMWLQKKCKPLVRTLVLCRGTPYGSENNIFHYIFKFGYYNQQIPIIKPGTQIIPIIYIKDLCRMLQQIIDNFPVSKLRYLFAVQPEQFSLKQFTYKICKALNEDHSKVRFLNAVEFLEFKKELFTQPVVDSLSVNLKFENTYFKDFKFTEINEEFWIRLVEEFRRAKNFHPVKIVLDGPPLVGKTEHARILSEYYQIPYIDTTKILTTYIEYLEEKIKDITVVLGCLGIEDENTSVIDEEDAEVKENLERRIKIHTKELFDLKVYFASHKDFENQEFNIISRCIIALISTKQHNVNQGYILDSFPFDYSQASKIFYNTERIKIENTESNDSLNNYKLILKPTHVVILDASEELLCNRAMNFTETEAIIRRCLRHQMLPRLDEYRDRDDGALCLANLFYDHDLIPIHIQMDESTKVIDTVQRIKTEIGPPFVYPLSDVEKRILNDKITQQQIKEKEEEKRKAEELKQQLHAQRERKLLEWTNAYKKIREQEDDLNAIKTLPLRQYLEKYVLPTLTDGILKVAEIQPDDPIDFLAEYLFKNNPVGQQVPPFCTTEQRKRFEDMFYKDINFDESVTSLLQPPDCIENE